MLFSSSRNLPPSFERWSKVDAVVASESLHAGPSVQEVRTLKQWLSAYRNWRAGYLAFLKSTETAAHIDSIDQFDRRQLEHYAALLLQSGQWHAILLLLIEDVDDSDQSHYLSKIDKFLGRLREIIAKATHQTCNRPNVARPSRRVP